MRKAYKYRIGTGLCDNNGLSLFQRDLDNLEHNRVWASLKDSLNDPMETKFIDSEFLHFLDKYMHIPATQQVKQIYDGIKTSIVNKNGIFCLCNSFENDLLWGYYADGHKGYCVEYDIDIISKQYNYNPNYTPLDVIDVDYPTEMPEIKEKNANALIQNHDEMFKLLIGSKPNNWKHEDEVRLIFEKSEFVAIDYRAITGVYFGMKTSDADIQSIMKVLKGRGVIYYKMFFPSGSYKMQRNKIEDYYKDEPKYYPLTNVADLDDFYFSEHYLNENFKYSSILRKAVEKVKVEEPYISGIYQACIEANDGEILFNIFTYTGEKAAPVRKFQYSIHEFSQ